MVPNFFEKGGGAEMGFLIGIAAVVILWLFLIFPSARSARIRLSFSEYIAHRGLHDLSAGVPENSTKAFLCAIEKGFAIELDVSVTADGRVVVFHDRTLKRVCGDDRRVEDLSYHEISGLYLFDTGCKIPTLKEVLALVNGRVPLLIELKSQVKTNRRLCEAVSRELLHYRGEYCVQSFYPPALYWFRRHRPEVLRGQLASDFIKTSHRGALSALSGWLLFNFLSRPDFISYDQKFWRSLPLSVTKLLGAKCFGWTFESKNVWKEKQRNGQKRRKIRGFDFCIFEHFLP